MLRRAVVTFVVLGLVVVGVGAFSRWYLNGQIRRVRVAGLQQAGLHGTENVLLVGSTDRCGLKHQDPGFGLCSQGVTGINSDVVMILHLDTTHHRASLLSIPRDTFVPNARTTGAYKIDAALYEGSSQLVNAIQDAFGIPINHYVELNFDGFQSVVDALGGIRMYFPEPVYDDLSGLNVQTVGCQSLNGFAALAVARARHLQYKPATVTSTNPAHWPADPESDLSRIRRDHEFLRVLAATVAKRGLGNPFTDRKLLTALAPQLKVDTTFTLAEMARLVLAFHTLDPNTVPQLTLPVSVDNSLSFLYKGNDYGNVALPSEPEDHQVISQFLGLPATADAMTGQRLAAPSTVTVAVENGTGVHNQATTTAAALTSLGFNVVATADTAPTGPISETVVYYNDPTTRAQAEQVVHALSGIVVMAHGPTQPGATVTVVTGSDFTVSPALAPPAPTTTTQPPETATSKPPNTTNAAPVTVENNPAITSHQLSAPTAATSQLAEFDPRSCTATGGPGP